MTLRNECNWGQYFKVANTRKDQYKLGLIYFFFSQLRKVNKILLYRKIEADIFKKWLRIRSYRASRSFQFSVIPLWLAYVTVFRNKTGRQYFTKYVDIGTQYQLSFKLHIAISITNIIYLRKHVVNESTCESARFLCLDRRF